MVVFWLGGGATAPLAPPLATAMVMATNADQRKCRQHAVQFLLVIEGLEGARCATARETGTEQGLARSSLSITVGEKRKGLRAVKALAKRYSQLKPRSQLRWSWISFGPPTWLEHQAQIFAQLDPGFPPFGHLRQLKPTLTKLLC